MCSAASSSCFVFCAFGIYSFRDYIKLEMDMNSLRNKLHTSVCNHISMPRTAHSKMSNKQRDQTRI